jgi:cytochrome P450
MTDMLHAGDLGAGVPSFPMARECPMHPPTQYREMSRTEPVSRVRMPDGQFAWLVTGHELGRKVLADPRLSSDRAHPAFPLTISAEARKLFQENDRQGIRWSMIGLDAPEHGAHRKMLISEFSVRRVAALRPRVQEIVDTCVDDLLAAPRPADLVELLSLAVPSMVICELLGVPYEQRHGFHQWTKTLISRVSSIDERRAAGDALVDFLDGLVTAKENGEPGDDVLGRLILRNRETTVMTHQELVSNAILLLIAGHETTANMISLGTVALLENPEQRAEVVADSSLLPDAIEEMLRYFTIVESATARVATEDIELGDVVIAKDDGILVAGLAANWDESVFDNPEELDFHRGARHHVAFGYGVHQCLGQNLARVELEIVFETLFRRVPSLRLAVPADELPYKTDAGIYGIHKVPVNF